MSTVTLRCFKKWCVELFQEGDCWGYRILHRGVEINSCRSFIGREWAERNALEEFKGELHRPWKKAAKRSRKAQRRARRRAKRFIQIDDEMGDLVQLTKPKEVK